MSRFIKELKDKPRGRDVGVSCFWGGEDRRACIQLTQRHIPDIMPDGKERMPFFDVIQLDRKMAIQLRNELNKWLEK